MATEENWAEEVAAPAVEETQDWGAEELAVEEDANEPKMFGKWDLTEVKCMDMALADYIKFDKSNGRYLAHNSTRVNKTRFKKAQMHIVERLVNALMQKGRNNGKKLLSMRIVKHTFEIIHVMTGENPVQICVSAIMNGGPREDSTRIGRAGSVRRQACDVSPMRRVNQAIWLITTGAKNAAFRNIKTVAECLADELMNAAKGSSNSFCIKKKDELERVAKSNR
jgi:small subunit ribosomal protein S5e